jgi:hypothetical protein
MFSTASLETAASAYWIIILIIGFTTAALVLRSGYFAIRRRWSSKGPERRDSPRRKSDAQVLVTRADLEAYPCPGRLVDSSIGGLRLAYPKPVAVGAILNVRLASRTTVRWVEVEVRHCAGANDYWELGCQFRVTPSWDVLPPLLFSAGAR